MNTDNNFKFTPGPWTHEGNKIVDSDGVTVAKCGWLTQSEEEAEATAALIAAAPRMYNLLLDLLGDILADDLPIQDRPAAYEKIVLLIREIQGENHD